MPVFSLTDGPTAPPTDPCSLSPVAARVATTSCPLLDPVAKHFHKLFEEQAEDNREFVAGMRSRIF